MRLQLKERHLKTELNTLSTTVSQQGTAIPMNLIVKHQNTLDLHFQGF